MLIVECSYDVFYPINSLPDDILDLSKLEAFADYKM